MWFMDSLGTSNTSRKWGEKLLVSWQRLKLSGVLWLQETCDNQEYASQEPESAAACAASPIQPCVCGSLSLALTWHTKLWFPLLSKGNNHPSFPEAYGEDWIRWELRALFMPGPLLISVSISYCGHHCHVECLSLLLLAIWNQDCSWWSHVKQPSDQDNCGGRKKVSSAFPGSFVWSNDGIYMW